MVLDLDLMLKEITMTNVRMMMVGVVVEQNMILLMDKVDRVI
jgi:hypothetical protein